MAATASAVIATDARRPVLILAGEQVLPASESLTRLLPGGGLQRGTTTVVTAGGPGSTALALELLAGISRAGHWCAVAGLPLLGISAAAERGVVLERLLIVRELGGAGRWQQIVATLFDTVEAVVFAPASKVRASDGRRLAARARERQAVFVVLDRHRRWEEPVDLRCQVTSSSWSGLGAGHGLLRERLLDVEVSGRGAAARPRRARLGLSA
ncbi:MAG: hypothetical protein ACRDZP_04225 [Acidimicrobiales bacterium]